MVSGAERQREKSVKLWDTDGDPLTGAHVYSGDGERRGSLVERPDHGQSPWMSGSGMAGWSSVPRTTRPAGR